MGQDIHSFTFLESYDNVGGLVRRFCHQLLHVERLWQLIKDIVQD